MPTRDLILHSRLFICLMFTSKSSDDTSNSCHLFYGLSLTNGCATSRRLWPSWKLLPYWNVRNETSTRRKYSKLDRFAATPTAGIVTPNISALCHECHSFPTLLTDRIPGATIDRVRRLTTDTMGVRPWKTRSAQCLLTEKSVVAP